MKKITILLVSLLTAYTVSAQTMHLKDGAGALMKTAATHPACMKTAKAVPSRVELAEGEKVMGFYTGDDAGSDGTSISFGNEYKGQYFQAGCDFPESVTAPFVGGQITRVRFVTWDAKAPRAVKVYTVTGTAAPELVAEESVSNCVEGWNDITLTSPITIESGKSYLVTYEFMQRFNKYPMTSDYYVNPNGSQKGGMIIYGDLGGGEKWADWSNTGSGNFIIQAVVNGGTFADYDIALSDLATYGEYARRGCQCSFQFQIKSSGNKYPESYSLKVQVDGTDADADIKLPASINGINQTASGTLYLPADMASGTHSLTVSVDRINGETPSGDTGDDKQTVQFKAFSKKFNRTMQLVEHFTSQYCTNCPLGYDALNLLQSKRNDIAWVSVHGNMSSTQVDEYTLPESYYIQVFSTKGFPAASFNRVNISGKSLAMTISAPADQAEGFTDQLSEVIDLLNTAYYPSFATVGISTELDDTKGKLKIKVYGERSAEDYPLFAGDDAVLTVYVTEDGLKSMQKDLGNATINDYPHDNVLRAIASAPLGDIISWSGDTYENDYEVSIGSGWNADNLNVTAFINRPIVYDETGGKFSTKIDNAWVINTNKVKAGGSVSGLRGVAGEAGAHEVARYTADGRKVNAPVRGLNIVKMSDGRTVKAIVR